MTRKQKITKVDSIKFYVLIILATSFGVAGMIMPPQGVIDPSVLILIAQMLVLAGAIFGLEINFDIKNMIAKAGKDCDETDEKE